MPTQDLEVEDKYPGQEGLFFCNAPSSHQLACWYLMKKAAEGKIPMKMSSGQPGPGSCYSQMMSPSEIRSAQRRWDGYSCSNQKTSSGQNRNNQRYQLSTYRTGGIWSPSAACNKQWVKTKPELMFPAPNSSVSRRIYHLQSHHWWRGHPSSEDSEKKVHFHTTTAVKGDLVAGVMVLLCFILLQDLNAEAMHFGAGPQCHPWHLQGGQQRRGKSWWTCCGRWMENGLYQ